MFFFSFCRLVLYPAGVKTTAVVDAALVCFSHNGVVWLPLSNVRFIVSCGCCDGWIFRPGVAPVVVVVVAGFFCRRYPCFWSFFPSPLLEQARVGLSFFFLPYVFLFDSYLQKKKEILVFVVAECLCSKMTASFFPS